MLPGKFVEDPLTRMHHLSNVAVPLGSGIAVAVIEVLPERVTLLVVVHDTVGATAAPAQLAAETLTNPESSNAGTKAERSDFIN